jgi:acetoin utilization deacetylase AcuC-like enzyme
LPFLEQAGVLDALQILEPREASEPQLLRVHTSDYLRGLRRVAERGGGWIDADTYMTAASYDMALLAAGSVIAVVDSIMTDNSRNGLALIRPPGHHASQDRAEGFCLLNNVAVAARHAQAKHGIERVLIVDFDVHHGNGTQSIFYADSSVMFASLHMVAHYFYPGSGRLQEIGSGRGRGYTLNFPFPPGVGDAGYLDAVEQVLLPRARAFRPQLILVSAGFDVHWRDPLAAAALSLSGIDRLVGLLIDEAEEMCAGRIGFVLEGGYFRDALWYGVLNLCNALAGRQERYDPLGTSGEPETDISSLLTELRRVHLPT